MSNIIWEKLGVIIEPDGSNQWLNDWISASCLIKTDIDGIFRVYCTGKDNANRSRIGTFLLELETLKVYDVVSEPVVELGEKGTFDENGTGYPFVIKKDGQYWLFYLGWIQGVHVPWYNGLFLAKSDDGLKFEKVSKAPVFDRDVDDYLGVGSMCIIEDLGEYKMWYSRFESWDVDGYDHKHFYNIKYASSKDCMTWERERRICIDFKNKRSEYAIAKPSVIKYNNKYFMWYSHRGESYKLGFAVSDDGVIWRRYDSEGGLKYSNEGWDSTMQCYPFAFIHNEEVFILYNGNGYGKTGLGVAKTSLKGLESTFRNA